MTPSDPQGTDFIEARQRGAAGLRPYSPMQLLFLLRLSRLLRQREEYTRLLSPDDWRMKLFNKAIYSTFCDCVEQGIGEDAKLLFQQYQRKPAS